MNNKKKISFSMIIDNKIKENQNLIPVHEREIHSWIKNESVTHCYNKSCNAEFWFYLRKHHCRACGRIFCYKCSSKTIELPTDIEKYPNNPLNYSISNTISNVLLWKDTKKERVCDNCYTKIYNIKRIRNLIIMFELIDVDIFTLYNFMGVCKSWNQASIYLLSKFREIQYKLPTQELTEKEKKMLLINKEYIVGHKIWSMQYIKSFNDKDFLLQLINNYLPNKNQRKKKLKSCLEMMCSRQCESYLFAEDAIELLQKEIKNDIILKFIANSFIDLDESELLCYLPYITFYLYNNKYLVTIILNKCIDSINIRTEFYWLLTVYNEEKLKNFYENVKKSLLEYIIEKLDETELNKLLLTVNNVVCLNTIKDVYISNLSIEEKECKILNILNNSTKHYNIIDPTICFNEIDIKNIKIMDSASKPIVIPLKSDNKIIKIMYKNENLFKDLIIVKIIKLIDIILKKEEKLDLDIITYKVMPISKNSGVVEMVENSVTIYNILEKMKTSIQNYIIQHNKNKTIAEIRDKFIKSTAAYCIISYILGFGDRHLDNIMINKNGSLFHIDFGYILGCDPKYSYQNIKITPSILDALGGVNSPDYKTFQQLCSRIYNCLRQHINLFMNLLSILTELNCGITKEYLTEEMIKRFEPGENTIEAKVHIVNKLNNSKNTYEHTIVDFVHKTVKENNVVNKLNNILHYSSKYINELYK